MVGTEIHGTWAVSGNTASAGTAFYRFVPPYAGGKGGPMTHKVDGNGRMIPAPRSITHVSSLIYAAGTTAHDVVIMRPLNWTYITEAVTANDTTVVLAADPGAYSTAYKYPLPNGTTKPANVANNAIAGSDYVAFQLRDGTWHVSAVTSVSSLTLTLTTATPNVTGGGCDANTVLYFFGVSTDSNPQTGLPHLYLTSTASTRVSFFSGQGPDSAAALNPGDPLIIYSANASNAGTLICASGYYADR